MRARVPEDALALGVVEVQQLQLAALLEGTLKVPQRLLGCVVVETSDNGALEEALADAARNVCRAGDPRLALDDLAVAKRDCDLLCVRIATSASRCASSAVGSRTYRGASARLPRRTWP